MIENAPMLVAEDYLLSTNKNLFLTGRAGTGKTTFLKRIIKSLPHRTAIVAPTGVAAINAGGATIHSFFQIGFGPFIPGATLPQKFVTKAKIDTIKAVDLLVIDEISMVRADLLDAVDHALRRYKNKAKPFGGVQLLMIGDLQQLAPVVKDDEWHLLADHYKSPYFFDSKALQLAGFETIELRHIYRQTDEQFIALLNTIRNKNYTQSDLDLLNTRYIPEFEPPKDKNYITLTTTNRVADGINQKKLTELETKSYFKSATVTGEFPESMYPIDAKLEFKKGAQIMFIKNDSSRDKRYFNGKLGEIAYLSDQEIKVFFREENQTITVNPEIWENTKYVLNEKNELEQSVMGSFSQMPIKLAWAITIHKSQGLTFDHAIIDAQSSFAHGQVYVALSRCRTFEGLVLRTKIQKDSVITDRSLTEFTEKENEKTMDADRLKEAKIQTQQQLIHELYDFEGIDTKLNSFKRNIEIEARFYPQSVITELGLAYITFHDKVADVCAKFRSILNRDFHQNKLLAEQPEINARIVKGANVLSEILEKELYLPLSKLDLTIDNQETQAQIFNVGRAFLEDIFGKIKCFEVTKIGFDTVNYLKAKTDAKLDFPKIKLFEKEKQYTTTDTKFEKGEDAVLRSLKMWRNAIAQEKNIEPYMVLPQKTILAIAQKMPRNGTELGKISGMGTVKVRQFGAEILEIIAEFLPEKAGFDHELDIYEPIVKPQKVKLEKVDSLELTYSLFLEGKNVAQIAAARNLAESTVEGHITKLITKGKIQSSQVLSNNEISLLQGFIIDNPTANNTEIVQALGNKSIDYKQVRWFVAGLQQDNYGE